MDKEIAKHVVDVAFRSASSLNDLIPLLKEHCSDVEYKIFLKGIATASFGISTEILALIYKDFPEIKDELESKINKYGKLIW